MKIDFSSSWGPSLGVEWELALVDLDTRELTSASNEILAEIGPDGGTHPKAKHELLQSCVEIITDVCATVEEVRADLATTAAEVQAAAGRRGLGILCSGSHPITDWATQDISDDERYRALVERNQWLARQLQIFGVHVHVGVREPDKAIPIVNALLAYLPHLLALSASSPYWIGCDTGLASYRSKIFEALPTAGLPYQLSGWDEFERYMELLISTNAIQTVREVWWDIRPHPNFGTVEVRICDGLPTLDEVTAVAALAQCLVDQMDTQLDRGYQLPEPRAWIVRENKWRAARYGLNARLVDSFTLQPYPVRQIVANQMERLRPIADQLECRPYLERVATIAAGPSWADRQLAMLRETGDPREVVRRMTERQTIPALV